MAAGDFSQAFIHIFMNSRARANNAKYEAFSLAVRRDFLRSARPILLIALTSAGVLWLTGRIGPDLELHWGRVCASLGALLAGWATWFALADGNSSYKRQRPDEIARSGVFRALMWPGILLSVVGAAWWP